MSAYTFEKYAKYMDSWFAVDGSTRFRCWYYDVNVSRSAGRLQLQIPEVQSWNNGPFRCVQNNGTEQDSVSNSLSVPVHYLRDVSLFKDTSFYSRYSEQLKVLTVAPGGAVEVECSATASENPKYSWSREGDDWVELSNKLKIQKVREEDAGTYTCTVQHPSVPSLSKTRTLQLLVVPGERGGREGETERGILRGGEGERGERGRLREREGRGKGMGRGIYLILLLSLQ
ncbi:hypothetical protein EOD39_21565 [Acipenser ruthenus]|uniref:Ig-like domain-containing protein n=1 Tax=Acipenser ruthenus TaxID=7906 RepID=A0A444UMJ7_ACIRT|nr:hypothetical protein EOD39_21565 [Acipenser ruthenus]